MIPGGAGTKSGADWDNAWSITEFSSWWTGTVTAGDLVYVYSGTYDAGGDLSSTYAGSNTNAIKVIGVSNQGSLTPAQGTDRPLIINTYFNTPGSTVLKNLRVQSDRTSSVAVLLDSYSMAFNCDFICNSLDNSLTTNRAIDLYPYSSIYNCYVQSSSTGVYLSNSSAKIESCFVDSYDGNTQYGIYWGVNSTTMKNTIIKGFLYGIRSGITTGGSSLFKNNTIDCSSRSGTYGFYLDGDLISNFFINNIIVNSDYGIYANSTFVDDSNVFDYNNFYNVTTKYTNLNAGAHDTEINPQFVDSANDNYSVGANMKAKGYPNLIQGSASYSYTDLGAIQRKESGESISITIQ